MDFEILEIDRKTTSDYDCSYLPNRSARLEYRTVNLITKSAFGHLLERGWRRFGRELFRPVCRQCQECRPLRVLVDQYSPSKSQRRAVKRNANIQIVVRPPQLTVDHIRLFNAYHQDMHHRKGWSHVPISPAAYRYMFLGGDDGFAREFLYIDEGRLVGVGIVDVVGDAISSAYFFHDPQWRSQGPGVFSMVKEWEFAREHGLRHQYLGFWIKDCPSMSYKANYGPFELLSEFVEDDEIPEWKAP